MSNINMEIRQVHEDETGLNIEEKSELAQWNEIEQLEVSIHQLTSCANLISFHGLNNSSLALLKANHLLCDTSLSSLGLESFTTANTQIAVESMTEAAKTKIAEWSAKVLSFIKNMANKTTDFVSSLRANIVAKSKVLLETSGEVLDKGVAYAKAHPYKTVFGALAAAALVIGVIKFASVSAPGVDCTGSQLKSYFDRIKTMTKGIKSPFSKVASVTGTDQEITSSLIKFTDTALKGAPDSVEKLSVLGWTKTNISSIVTQIESLWNSFSSTMQPFWNNVIKPIDKVVSSTVFFPKMVGDKIKEKTATKAIPWAAEKIIGSIYYPIMIKLFKSLWDLLKAFFVKAFEVVNTTFTNIKNSKSEKTA